MREVSETGDDSIFARYMALTFVALWVLDIFGFTRPPAD